MDMDVGNMVQENPKYKDLVMTPELLFQCLVVAFFVRSRVITRTFVASLRFLPPTSSFQSILLFAQKTFSPNNHTKTNSMKAISDSPTLLVLSFTNTQISMHNSFHYPFRPLSTSSIR